MDASAGARVVRARGGAPPGAAGARAAPPVAAAEAAYRLVRGARARRLLPAGGAHYLRVAASAAWAPEARAAPAPPRAGAGAGHLGATLSAPVPLASGEGLLVVEGPRGMPGFTAADRAALQAFAALVGRRVAAAAGGEPGPPVPAAGRACAAALVQAQEEERARLSRALHDEAGHTLTMAILRLDLALRALPAGAAAAREALEQARAALADCAAGLHDLAFALRPRLLDDLGLPAALRSLAHRARLAGALEVAVAVRGETRALGEALELTAFRAVQEGLTNARKHGAATRVAVTLAYGPARLTVRVDDDGGGPPRPAAAAPAGGRVGLGLGGLRERAALLGGTLALVARPGGGARLELALPLAPPAGGAPA